MMLMFIPLVFSLLSLVKSENKVILNHINNRNFLMLTCNITDDGCCQNMKEMEFFKNGEGVCTIISCKEGCSIPLTRDDTEYYRCGCMEREMRNSYIYVSKSRSSDFGNWTCGCLDKGGGRNCHSSVMVISKEILGKDVEKSNQESSTWTVYLKYLLFFVDFGLAVIIVLVVVIIFLRWCVSKQMTLTMLIRLTNLLFWKKKNVEERDRVDEAELARRELQSLLDKIENVVNDAGLAQRESQSILDKIQDVLTVDDNWLAQREVQSLLHMQVIHNDLMDSLKKKDPDLVLSYLVAVCPALVLNATRNIPDIPDWCGCGKCQNMKEKHQSFCCKERGVEFGCFSKSKDFISKCLSKKAIYKFYQTIERGKSNLKPDVAAHLKSKIPVGNCKDGVPDLTNRWFRKLSYVICNEILPVSKKELFTPVPTCCLLAIREAFPDSRCFCEIL